MSETKSFTHLQNAAHLFNDVVQPVRSQRLHWHAGSDGKLHAHLNLEVNEIKKHLHVLDNANASDKGIATSEISAKDGLQEHSRINLTRLQNGLDDVLVSIGKRPGPDSRFEVALEDDNKRSLKAGDILVDTSAIDVDKLAKKQG